MKSTQYKQKINPIDFNSIFRDPVKSTKTDAKQSENNNTVDRTNKD